MLDDLLDIFDRDHQRSGNRPPRRRGLRGLLDRLTPEHDDDRDRDEPWREDDTRRQRSRHRDSDRFDLDD